MTNGTPPLIRGRQNKYLLLMALLTQSEFAQMERLLAGLLVDATSPEEEQILHLHARLKSIIEAQQGLNDTKAHLLNLTKQNP